MWLDHGFSFWLQQQSCSLELNLTFTQNPVWLQVASCCFYKTFKKSEQHHHRPTELNNVYTILLFFYFCSTNYLLLSPALGQDSGCLWSSLCLTANSVKGHSCATWLELLCTAPSAGLHLCAGTHTGSSSHQVSEPPPETAIWITQGNSYTFMPLYDFDSKLSEFILIMSCQCWATIIGTICWMCL